MAIGSFNIGKLSDTDQFPFVVVMFECQFHTCRVTKIHFRFRSGLGWSPALWYPYLRSCGLVGTKNPKSILKGIKITDIFDIDLCLQAIKYSKRLTS